MEDFSIAPETQNEALQLIEQFLADEEGFQSLEAEREKDGGEKQLGPARIELLVQEKNPSRLPSTRKRLVITSLLEPTGNFRNYLLSGREWRDLEKRDLSRIKTSANSDTIDIIEMFIYDSNSIYKEEAEPFSTEITKQQTAWKRAHREFHRLSEAEKLQLARWDGAVGMSPAVNGPTKPASYYPDLDLDDDYSGYGWIGARTPAVYKPSPPHRSYFRVAGDGIGAELLKKHQEKLLAAKLEVVVVPDPVPEKAHAPAKSVEITASATLSKTALPIIYKPDPDFQECYCGMTGCEYCHLTSILAESKRLRARGKHYIH